MRVSKAFALPALVLGCWGEQEPFPLPRPDLAASVLAPGGLVAGGTFSVTVTVENRGGRWAAPSKARLYISTQADLGGDSVRVGLVDISSLPPGDEYTAQAEFTAPALLEGDYHVCVRADGLYEIVETDETNNVSSAGPVSLSLPAVPDIVPGRLCPAVWEVQPGGSFDLERGVANQGGADAGAFEWEVYLSADQELSGDDVLVASGSLSGLVAGATEAETVLCTVPGTTAEGSYYVGLAVDSGGDVTESDEENNVRWSSYRVLVGSAAPGRNFALAIGVSDYVGVWADLSCCDDDAVDFASMLAANRLRWETDHITVLTDAAATKAAILQAIGEMRDASVAGDRCVFLFSGHGTRLPDDDGDELDGYDEALVPHDFQYVTDDELKDEFIAFTGRKLCFIMDTCFSGGFAKGLGGAKGLPGDGFVEDLLRVRTGVKDLENIPDVEVLTASAEDGYAYEDPFLGHGIFVYFLLEGMVSDAADDDGDGLLSAEELFGYLEPRTVAYQPDQRPRLYDYFAGEIELTDLPSPAGDLRVQEVEVQTAWVRPGEDVTIWRSFSNEGPAASAGVLYSLYFSADSKLDGTDVHLHSFRIPELAPGETVAGWVTVSVPPAVAQGFYHVALVLDPDDTVAELNEFDNVCFTEARTFIGTEDAYEDDGLPSSSSPILVGESQDRTFLPSPDADWLSVDIADAAPSYTFETFNLVGPTDTVLRLYDTDQSTLLAENDDAGAGDYSSKIDHIFPSTGTYYLRVKDYRGSPGAYSIRVSSN